jgi:type I restriction enzyme M protein
MTARETFQEIRNYLAGQFVGATRDESILAEVVKCLFSANTVGSIFPGNLDAASDVEVARHYRQIFKNIRSGYPELFDQDDEFLLGPDALAWTMRRLAAIYVDESDTDVIGDAYEVFMGSALRGQEGQFFTPRNAIEFLSDAVDLRSTDVVIDPACGSGGFLAAALMRLSARAAGRSALKVYGIDKDASLVRLARIHLALLGADHRRIFNCDSIATHNGSTAPSLALPSEGEYDVVLTNPPFGARIVSALPAIAAKYELARKWRYDRVFGHWYATKDLANRVPPQVLFLEKCVRLLRPGGRCGMVVPESLLSSGQYRHVADYLLRNTRVKIVAGMPESLFKTSGKGGTHTKTCLLVFEKNGKSARSNGSKIFFAEAKWCGNDSRGRVIAKDDTHEILRLYRDTGPRTGESTTLGFWLDESQLDDFSLSPRRYDPSIVRDLNGLRSSHEIVRFGDLVDQGWIAMTTGHEVGKLAYGTGQVPFVRTSDLSNWEIKSDPKHGVSEEVYGALRGKQDVRECDLLMVKDGTYLIGTCAMITSYDLRIVFQSHIYKIRVDHPDRDYLNPHLLLAVLSSDIVQSQIRSRRVTHDIIDSLGARILDLELALPASIERRQAISELVEKSIQDRVEARELARKARRLVCEPCG